MNCFLKVIVAFIFFATATGCVASRAYSIRYVPRSEEAVSAYEGRNARFSETRPCDAMVFTVDTGNSFKDRVYIQNAEGKNIDVFDNEGVSTWARFWNGGGNNLLGGIPAAATLGWFNYKAAGRQSDNVTATGGDGGKAGAAAQTGGGIIDIKQ